MNSVVLGPLTYSDITRNNSINKVGIRTRNKS